MERVAVVGSSGSGKTTVAQAISARLDIPHLELDSIFHQPRWTPLPTGDFQDAVRTFTDQKAWVVDGNYTGQGITDIVWPLADTVVWLDLPRAQTMRRVVGRTFRRISRGEQLWNENQEGWLNVVDPRPDNNIILWTWTRYSSVRAQYGARFIDPQWSRLTLVRLGTPAEVESFVAALHPS